jgi:hypothetical protein
MAVQGSAAGDPTPPGEAAGLGVRRRLRVRVRELASAADGLRLLAGRERDHWWAVDLPLRRRLGLWRRGYNSFCAALYDLERHPRGYVTEWQRAVRSKRPNRAYQSVLDDKLLFWLVLAPYSDHVLPVVAQVEGGTVRPFVGRAPGRRVPLLDYLGRLEGTYVLKPVGWGHGRGVFVWERRAGVMLVNGAPASERSVRQRLGQGAFLVTPKVEQAAYARAMFPDSGNTVRLMTFYDEAAGAAFVGRAGHRIGTGRTRPVDGWLRGGLSAPVDLETGRLGRACTFPKDGKVVWHATHPETGGPIEGVAIPHWDQVREHVAALASRLPYLPYIGWDVIVTDEGFSILEGNGRPDVNFIQVHGPLLVDPRIERFYRAHGVI